MLQLVCTLFFQLPRNPASVMITQSIYETLFYLEDDSTPPTSWQLQGQKDKRSKPTFFKPNWFPQTTHTGVGYLLSLYWDCTVLFMYGHNITTTYSSSSRERKINKGLSNRVRTTTTAALVFCNRGHPLYGQGGLFPSDDKFQKRRNSVAFQVAQVVYGYGALMILSKKSRNNSCLSPAVVLNQ